MLDLARLSPAQRQAVLARDGPLLIVAGPGSGKTTVLASRIAYVVIARQVAPASVLALTFAARAASDLRTRLHDLLADAAREVSVATFHAFGLRVVRQWSEELGLRPGPLAVYDGGESQALLRDVAAQAGLDRSPRTVTELAQKITCARLRPEDSGVSAEIRGLASAYEGALWRRRAIDYPGMLALPLRLFAARPDILHGLQDRFRYVVCDEFQDICAAQYGLLRQLCAPHRNLVAVGDPCQGVFGWRGADVRFLRDGMKDFRDAQRIDLTENFRSTGRIVELANAVSAWLGSRPALWTANPPGIPISLRPAADEEDEANFVAAEIGRLLDTQAVRDLSHVAVLSRTNHQAMPLALALQTHRLAYRIQGGRGLFMRRDVRDAPADPRLVLDTDDTTRFGVDAAPAATTMELHASEGLANPNEDQPAVLLTTIHGAKGGEWHVVFVVGLEEGLLPHHRTLGSDCRRASGLDEELRLLYVAVTRARERLYLSYCRSRQQGARREPRRPSRFLRDLPPNLLVRPDA